MSDFSLMLEVKYCKKGYFSTARATETTFLFLDNIDLVNEYRREDFTKAVKKALKLFKSDKLFDIEMVISESNGYFNDKRQYLICQNWENRENGTFKLYDYTTRNATNINDVSERVAFKTIEKAIDNAINAELTRLDNKLTA